MLVITSLKVRSPGNSAFSACKVVTYRYLNIEVKQRETSFDALITENFYLVLS